jgi:hypothetical protein
MDHRQSPMIFFAAVIVGVGIDNMYKFKAGVLGLNIASMDVVPIVVEVDRMQVCRSFDS